MESRDNQANKNTTDCHFQVDIGNWDHMDLVRKGSFVQHLEQAVVLRLNESRFRFNFSSNYPSASSTWTQVDGDWMNSI